MGRKKPVLRVMMLCPQALREQCATLRVGTLREARTEQISAHPKNGGGGSQPTLPVEIGDTCTPLVEASVDIKCLGSVWLCVKKALNPAN